MAFISLLVGVAFFMILCLVQMLKNMLGLQGTDQEVLRQQVPVFHSDIQILSCIETNNKLIPFDRDLPALLSWTAGFRSIQTAFSVSYL